MATRRIMALALGWSHPIKHESFGRLISDSWTFRICVVLTQVFTVRGVEPDLKLQVARDDDTGNDHPCDS